MTKGFAHFVRLLLGGEFKRFVVAALPPENVESAIAALRDAGAGVRQGDLRHRSGCQPHEEVCLCRADQEDSALGRALHRIVTNLTEEGHACEIYREELAHGHDILAVRAPDRRWADRISEILVCNGGHQIRYYGDWTVLDLAPEAICILTERGATAVPR
ncbi:MAG: hypothetical protein AB1758_08175 [Candidatus Eremiobacterota bacterium]